MQRLDRRREVGQRQPAYLPLGREHRRPRAVGAAGRPRVEHDGQAAAPPGRHVDDVAGPQRLQRRGRLRAPAGGAGARQRGLAVGDRAAQPGVLLEVAEVAGHRLAVALEALLVARHLAGEPDHGPVGLELRERRLQQVAGLGSADLADQVDRHVVRRPEAGAQRIGAGGREPGQRRRLEPRCPEHDRVALDVDAAPPGPAGELGVLPRRDVGVALAVPLHQPLEHDRAGRHVDAERQRLGGEHRLDQPAHEQLLDDLLEGRAACRRGGRRCRARGPPATRGSRGRAGPRRGMSAQRASTNARTSARSSAASSRSPDAQALGDRGVAAGPAEDERDRRQQPLAVEPVDHLDPAGRADPADPPPAPSRALAPTNGRTGPARGTAGSAPG